MNLFVCIFPNVEVLFHLNLYLKSKKKKKRYREVIDEFWLIILNICIHYFSFNVRQHET